MASLAFVLLALSPKAQAELQFDVFLGYDNIVREAGWFPIVCEVYNDGPPFNAQIEITTAQMRADQVRRIAVELPTNTRKRIFIPMFAPGGRFFQWNARLLDDRKKIQAERLNLQPKIMAWEGHILGALPRSFAGMPAFPEAQQTRPELKPQVARLLVEQIPDHPITLESLDSFYLNSEKALDLKANQIASLLAWLHAGGHLIISIEQLGDITATPWLQQLLPAQLKDMASVTFDDQLMQWIRTEPPNSLSKPIRQAFSHRSPNSRRPSAPLESKQYSSIEPDSFLSASQIPVATGSLLDGQILVSTGNKPLIITANRGRGRISLLTFNPEREPFRSWKNRAWFWSRLVEIPGFWYSTADIQAYGGLHIDGVFGALIDSRQVRKLPVQWLLLLLVVYLVVIGPLDQYWLKRINRQMLTWITFPTYVVLFSLLIYFIGYKLRAGRTEWNELSVVDLLPRGPERAELRGRTYASVYSSANATFPIAFLPPSPEAENRTHAALRGEMIDLYGGRDGNRGAILQNGNLFRGEIFVPVWTSLLYVNDWLQPGPMPITASVTHQQNTIQVVVHNLIPQPLSDARIVIKGAVHELGTIPPGESKTFALDPATGIQLSQFVQQHGHEFEQAINQRRTLLGSDRKGWLENPSLRAMVASFPSYLSAAQPHRSFVSPAGFDLSPLVQRGDSILFAWAQDHSFTQPLNQFKPPISTRNSLLRLAIPQP